MKVSSCIRMFNIHKLHTEKCPNPSTICSSYKYLPAWESNTRPATLKPITTVPNGSSNLNTHNPLSPFKVIKFYLLGLFLYKTR